MSLARLMIGSKQLISDYKTKTILVSNVSDVADMVIQKVIVTQRQHTTENKSNAKFIVFSVNFVIYISGTLKSS